MVHKIKDKICMCWIVYHFDINYFSNLLKIAYIILEEYGLKYNKILENYKLPFFQIA